VREKISACITAGNEEGNIRRCLESVKWVDEIVVVDSFSRDRTPEICREYTDMVFKHCWLGYIGQKNLVKDLASNDWVLFLDADEEVSPELRGDILQEFERGVTRHFRGFEFPRMVRYLDRWITHGDWYPDVKLRLYHRDCGECGGREPHDRMVVSGPVKRLKGPLYHYTYRSISDQLATLNRFSTITAETQNEEGRSFNISCLLFRPLLRFLRGYLVRGGFLDGVPGLIIASTAAYGVFVKYAKLWELERLARRRPR
jgi:glycosyltransferase involved in cell wall biosynthesis